MDKTRLATNCEMTVPGGPISRVPVLLEQTLENFPNNACSRLNSCLNLLEVPRGQRDTWQECSPRLQRTHSM